MTLNDQLATALVLLAAVLLVLETLLQRKAPYHRLRDSAALTALEALMHASAEKGQRIVLALGGGHSEPASKLNSLSGLPLLCTIAQRAVFNDRPALARSGEGSLACLSQMVLRGVYKDAVATELFSPDYAAMAGDGGMGYIAGLLPEIRHPANAGVVLSGSFGPEAILVLDQPGGREFSSIAMSEALSAQALIFASASQISLGEDCFAAGLTGAQGQAVAASLRTQDILRVLIALGLLAALALTLGVVLL